MGNVPAGSTIDFYANDTADAGGNYEGKTWLGSFPVSGTDNSVVVPNLPVGSFLTATLTDAQNNTSQFSSGILVEPDSGTTPPNDGAALSQLTSLVAAQANLLGKLNRRKPKPSPALAAQVLSIELAFYDVFESLVNTSYTKGDQAFEALGLKFLVLDLQIKERATAILEQADAAKARTASSPRARRRDRQEAAALRAELNGEVAQDQALMGELEA